MPAALTRGSTFSWIALPSLPRLELDSLRRLRSPTQTLQRATAMSFNIRTKIAQAFKVVLGPLGLNKPTREPWPKILQVAAVIALQTLAYGIEQQIEHHILGERAANVVIAGQSWYQLM